MKVKKSEKFGLKLNIQKTKIMACGPIPSWQIDGETMEIVRDLILGAPKSLQMVTAAMKLKDIFSWKKSLDQPRQHIKKQRHYFADKGLSSQSYGFSSGHVCMWELDYKESWAVKKGWTSGVGDGQGGLECCGSWGRKESDTTEQLDWTELIIIENAFKTMVLETWNCPLNSV